MSSRLTSRTGRPATVLVVMALAATALPAPAGAVAVGAIPADALRASAGTAPATLRISTDRAGRPGDAPSGSAAVSATGRYVTFASSAGNLVPGDTNGFTDLFLRDRVTGAIERISVSSTGAQADGGTALPGRVSPDGRYVTFASWASNLVPGGSGDTIHVYLRDRANRTTRRVSVAGDGTPGNANSFGAAVSANGRYVAFSSTATNLVPADTNGHQDVFVRDVRYGTTRLVSVSPGARQGNGPSSFPVISDNGRYVGFLSDATTLGVPGASTNGNGYVKDLRTGAVELVSRAPNDRALPGGLGEISMSADGRRIAFPANPVNPGGSQVYVRDRRSGSTLVASRRPDGSVPDDASHSAASISANGRYVAFISGADDVVPGSHTGSILVRDLRTATTTVGGLTHSGRIIDDPQWEPAMSNTGVAFFTFASGVAPGGDDRHPYQVYFRQF